MRTTARWCQVAIAVSGLVGVPLGSGAQSERAAVEAFQKAGTPGAEHELLAGLVGDYELTSTFWPDPSAPPVVSVLPARRELLLGGRILRLDVGPDAGGFRGTGLGGFDNVTREFWYIWTDTTTTGVAHMTGRREGDGTGFFHGPVPTPAGPARVEVEIRTENRAEIHEYWFVGEDGSRVPYLKLSYVRKE